MMKQQTRKTKIEIEWPTVFLIAAVYVGYALVTIFSETLTPWLSIPLLALLLTQHSSLQHEVLHGHPFKNRFWSELTVFPAIGLFIPYFRFKQLHLLHHYDPNLTDPYDDPETNFLDHEVYTKLPTGLRWIYVANTTLMGRMLIGPAISTLVFYRDDILQIIAGNRIVLLAWAHHFAGIILLLIWLKAFGTISISAYLFAAYAALSLLKIRTFLEHQAHQKNSARSVIIEDRGLFALLFLNNNYHSVHHAYPRTPWYCLPDLYKSRRENFLQRNENYLYANYWQIFSLYFLRPKDSVTHPFWTRSNRTTNDKE